MDDNEARRVINYYKKRVEELAGENLKYDNVISGLKHELRKNHKGFALLSKLQRTFGELEEINSIFEITLQAVNETFSMDKSVILKPNAKEHFYTPSQWQGFRSQESENFPGISLCIPEEFTGGNKILLVTRLTKPTPLIEEIRSAFNLPFFICLPMTIENMPTTLLLFGRLKEVDPFYPPLNYGDVDTFRAIADSISATIRSRQLILLKKRAKDEEIARKLLQADNERKTKELDEARKLQYSMLPREVPPVPHLDIAVYMKPATEVGGDYYDFKYNNNENLTIAVGDATGHGMRAGTLVAAIKGLFSAEQIDTDIISFFNKCNSTIREMRLGNLYMAMMMARISGSSPLQMIVSSAGMPSALIYRKKTKLVEEIRIRGLPLGGSSVFKYVKKETSLSSGDTMLLMSDGFPELFNRQKEMLDYDKAKEIFCSIAEFPSKKIIESLNCAAEEWMDGADQEDDITFVVVKVK